MRKIGFTIAEFTISIAIMFLVIASCVPILFKKDAISKQAAKQYGKAVCSCRDEESVRRSGDGYRYCVLDFDKTGKDEFYTIKLIGGGSAGSTKKGGKSGQYKMFHLPAMPGRYVALLGRGGSLAPAINRPNGGTTAIYQEYCVDSATNLSVDCSDTYAKKHYRLIDYALGGVYPGNNLNDAELVDPDIIHGEEAPASETLTAGMGSCGKGGEGGAPDLLATNGTDGEVIIEW